MLKRKTSSVLASCWLAIVALVANSAGAPSQAAAAQEADPILACALATEDRIPVDAVYSIRGKYFYDGHHGSFLEIPDCESSISPSMTGDAAAKIRKYHEEFEKKCNAALRGDLIFGVFTGTFESREKVFYRLPYRDGQPERWMVNFFVVTAIDTNDLDISAIKCSG